MVIKSTNLAPDGAIGRRLKEERKRKDLNQTEFGELVGVVQKTQSLYEKGDRTPDAEYLNNLYLKADCDIQYIVTGFRSRLCTGEIDTPLMMRITRDLLTAMTADVDVRENMLMVADASGSYGSKPVADLLGLVGIATTIYNRVCGISNKEKRDLEIDSQIQFAIAMKKSEMDI